MVDERSSEAGSRERTGRRARATVLLVAGLWVAVEIVAALALPVHPGRHEVDQRVAEVEAAERAPTTVLISDSISYGALDLLDEVAEGVLDLSSNQSIGVAGNVFLLERLARRLAAQDPSGRVERVVYLVGPWSFGTDLIGGRFVDSNFASVFVDPVEIESVRSELGPLDPAYEDLARRMERFRRERWITPPSHLRRGHVRRPLALGLRQLGARSSGTSAPFEPTPEARERIARRSRESELPCSEASLSFLPRLVEAAAALGAGLEIGLAPVPPTLLAILVESGRLERLEARLRERLEGLGAVELDLRPRWRASSDAAFYDGTHLLPHERRAYAEELEDDLRRPFEPGGAR